MNTPIKLALAATAALMTFAGMAFAQEADLAAGKKVFKKCQVCHTIGEGAKKKIGPPLNNIIGAVAGAQGNFKYSKALLQASKDGLVWSEDKLKEYLHKPKKMIPRGKMSFPGLKKQKDIDNVVAYLKTFTKME